MKLTVAVIFSVLCTALTNPIEMKRNTSLIESRALKNVTTTCEHTAFAGSCIAWALDGDNSGCQWTGQARQIDNISSLKVERNYVCRFYE
jgi:hypothetical protein